MKNMDKYAFGFMKILMSKAELPNVDNDADRAMWYDQMERLIHMSYGLAMQMMGESEAAHEHWEAPDEDDNEEAMAIIEEDGTN